MRYILRKERETGEPHPNESSYHFDDLIKAVKQEINEMSGPCGSYPNCSICYDAGKYNHCQFEIRKGKIRICCQKCTETMRSFTVFVKDRSKLIRQMPVYRETARVIQALELPRYMIGVIPKPNSSFIADSLGLVSNLKVLEMMGVPFGHRDVSFLCNVVATSKTLEQLHLSTCWHIKNSLFSRISKKSYQSLDKAIATSESLQLLCISRTRMVHEGFLAALFAGSAHKLKKLILSRSQVKSASIQAVQKALEHGECQIQHLNLAGVYRDSNITPIAKALEVNTSLKELILSCNSYLLDDGADALANALRVNSTLESINFCDADIDVEMTFSTNGWKLFSKGLKEAKSIQRLDISDNNFTVEGMQYLLDGLRENGSITDITMQDIGVDPEGFDLIGDLIRTRSFKYLNISNMSKSMGIYMAYQGLSDRFLGSVAHSINGNTGMEVLKASHINMEGPNGLTPIISSLANNTTLRELDISGIRQDHLLRELTDSLTSNEHLLKLNLKSIPFSTDEFEYFAESLPKMKSLESILFGELDHTLAIALLNGMKDNDTLKHVDGPLGNESCWRMIDFYLRLNRGGRKSLKLLLPSVLLPRMLSRSTNYPDVLFEILREIQLHA